MSYMRRTVVIFATFLSVIACQSNDVNSATSDEPGKAYLSISNYLQSVSEEQRPLAGLERCLGLLSAITFPLTSEALTVAQRRAAVHAEGVLSRAAVQTRVARDTTLGFDVAVEQTASESWDHNLYYRGIYQTNANVSGTIFGTGERVRRDFESCLDLAKSLRPARANEAKLRMTDTLRRAHGRYAEFAGHKAFVVAFSNTNGIAIPAATTVGASSQHAAITLAMEICKLNIDADYQECRLYDVNDVVVFESEPSKIANTSFPTNAIDPQDAPPVSMNAEITWKDGKKNLGALSVRSALGKAVVELTLFGQEGECKGNASTNELSGTWSLACPSGETLAGTLNLNLDGTITGSGKDADGLPVVFTARPN